MRWLSLAEEGVLDTKEAIASNPTMKGSVTQVIDNGHLATLINSETTVSELIHFEPKTELLTAEDPKFLYFIRNLIWSKFARQVGYYSIDFDCRYDVALSFAGEDRNLAEALEKELSAREISVFYDKNEQHRILANDVEEYLAPIYRSESRFVVPLLSGYYPKKIWTKFESEQFRLRFGEKSVIPIWFSDCMPGPFDKSRNVGGMTFSPESDFDSQVDDIVCAIAKRLEDERKQDSRSTDP